MRTHREACTESASLKAVTAPGTVVWSALANLRLNVALAVFNVLAHNRDDHARQFSFIMQRDGTWRLAPAYDLTWSPGPGGEHSSSILGHGKDISRAHVMALSKKADIAEHDAAQIIERTQTAIDRWDSYAAEYGVSQASAAMINAALARVWLDRIV